MGDSYPKFKIAAVQAAPVLLNREATVEKACRLIEEAAGNNAKIIGFSECFIPAYPHWVIWESGSWRGKVRDRYVELFKNAVEVPSRATDDLCETARQNDCYVVMGINEKDKGSMGTLYNTQLFISRTGTILGKHRKLVPTLGERLYHTGGDGSTLSVFETDFGGLSGLICGEHYNLLAKYTLLARGENLHVAGWPAFMCEWGGDFILQQYAYEGGLFIISASDYFSKEMKDKLGEDAENVEVGGGSSGIYGPHGEILAKAKPDREEILYADVDMEEIIKAKLVHDITGHYNRFDIFRLYINQEQHLPLRTLPGLLGTPVEKTQIPQEQAPKLPIKPRSSQEQTS